MSLSAPLAGWLLLGAGGVLGCAPEPRQVGLELRHNPLSPLALDATVSGAEGGRVTIEGLDPDGGRWHLSWQEASSAQHPMELVGLLPDSDTELTALVEDADGERWRSQPRRWTTEALDDGVPQIEVALSLQAPQGLTLFAPALPAVGSKGMVADFFGVDAQGRVRWTFSAEPELAAGWAERSAELQPDGSLLFLVNGGAALYSPGGRQLAWYPTPEGDLGAHHDVTLTPEGTVVTLQAEERVLDVPELGDQVTVRADRLIEVDESGDVLWSWSTFDHLPLRFPGELSRTPRVRGRYEMTHANSVRFVPELQALLVSLRHQNQVVAVSWPEGELLWTLGRGGDFELTEGQWFSSQHDARWLPGQGVSLYDNGNEEREPSSRAVRYALDGDQAAQVWSWDADVFTETYGGVEPVQGGMLVAAGGDRPLGQPVRVAEVDHDGQEQWSLLVRSGHWVYRAHRPPWWVEGAP